LKEEAVEISYVVAPPPRKKLKLFKKKKA